MKISLEEFKQQILTDYRLNLRVCANTPDEALHGCELAQVALSKYISTDAYVATFPDNAYTLRTNQSIAGNTISSAIEKAIAIKNNAPQIVVCSSARHIFDAIFDATSAQLPIAFVFWNMKDKNGTQRPNSDLLKLFNSFATYFRNGLSVQAVKGNDYPALCLTFEQQLSTTRTKRLPSVTIVEGADECTNSFSKWITERDIFSAKELLNETQQFQA